MSRVMPYTREAAEEDFAAAIATGDIPTAMQVAELIDRMPPPPPLPVPGAALWYARHGLPVFPISPGSKVPYPKTRGVLDATTDPDTVREMFAGRPDANLAIATGHRIDVIDFDGPEAHAAWSSEYPGTQTWEESGLPILAVVSTPRPGGMHLYIPASGRGNTAGLLPHVDYRGLGGYVLAPPSRTPAGTYVFVRPLDPETLP